MFIRSYQIFIYEVFSELYSSLFRILSYTINQNGYSVMKLLLLLLGHMFCLYAFGQNDSSAKFHVFLTNEGQRIQKGTPFIIDGDTITIETCKMYVSNFVFMDHSYQTTLNNNAIQLVDFFSKNYIEVEEQYMQSQKQFSFRIICDTTLKSMPPMTGDLSGSQGMFWSWTNGFMALKIEGKHSQSSLPQKNYVFHLGARDKTYIPDVIIKRMDQTEIEFDIKDLFKEHSFRAHPSMMEIDELSIGFLNQFSYSIKNEME